MPSIDIADLSLSFQSDHGGNSKTKYSEYIELNFLENFQTPYQKEVVRLNGEEITITRYDGEEVSSLFQNDIDKSYIIIEKCFDKQAKIVKNLNEWHAIEACSTPEKTNERGTPKSDLDITGSPLGCHFQNFKEPNLELSFQECSESNKKFKYPLKYYHPFGIDQARSLSYELKLQLKNLKSNNIYLPPIWIACDGKDIQKTAFVGVGLSEKGSFTSSMTSFGPHLGAEHLPTLDRINNHFSLGSTLPRTHTVAEAIYEVLPRKGLKSSSVNLCCEWQQPLSILCSPGLDAFTTINVHLESSEDRSETRFLFSEFETLRCLVQGLQERCLKWYQRREAKGVTHSLKEFFRDFNDRALDPKSKLPAPPSSDSATTNLDRMVESRFLEMRSMQEFPDQMWTILKGSENLSELCDGFRFIFESISNGTIRPRIFARRETQFAVICRDLIRSQGAIPALDKWQSIEMLIEMGLEKIKKDYISVFEVCDLASTEQLSCYANWSPKSAPHEQCLAKLEKMMVVLKIVVLLRGNLNLSNSALSHFTFKTLLDLKTRTALPKDFEFQVEMSLVRSIVDNIVPSIWIYATRSEGEDRPGSQKDLRFAIKLDEPFFSMEPHEDPGPLSEVESSLLEVSTFYSLCITTTGDVF